MLQNINASNSKVLRNHRTLLGFNVLSLPRPWVWDVKLAATRDLRIEYIARMTNDSQCFKNA